MSLNSVNNLEVRFITATETHTVRHPVLRPGRPLSSCIFDGDTNETTLHLGGFVNNEIVAVGSFFKNNHSDHDLKNAIQLRGMAVLEAYHKKGYGRQILEYGESFFKEKGYDIIWMNARVNALKFYSKLGYEKVGTVFEIPKVGEHYVLFKKL
ncbi:GNAT family N-acetyltransferase [Cellulophaga baltica]|uniref:GNAT family N-acetyltransferase n=1 Tax=Cellulophaga TaxID=104264 RepID=UPI001C06D20F|nr:MULTISPECIES: GNAT family N-acetyltransferase [Cellulophaga]MBU2995020.1 GNAT family N-acetyltransferase [Cellulophaga baltica]MDO6766415.1 GNAT family N-acetyltransferase [Cellulophaga sp. 1_MG-2023]